MYLVCFILWF